MSTRIARERLASCAFMKLAALLALAWSIRLDAKGDTQIVFPEES
jgi:hypothetical protein